MTSKKYIAGNEMKRKKKHKSLFHKKDTTFDDNLNIYN